MNSQESRCIPFASTRSVFRTTALLGSADRFVHFDQFAANLECLGAGRGNSIHFIAIQWPMTELAFTNLPIVRKSQSQFRLQKDLLTASPALVGSFVYFNYRHCLLSL